MLKIVEVGGKKYDRDVMNEYYNTQGLSMPQIAKKLGIKTRTVETVLRKFNICKNWNARVLSSDEGYRDKQVLYELIQQGLNASQIAKRFNVHARTVTHWLKKFGVPYSKALGYSRMNRNQPLRRANKQLRRAQKIAKKISKQKRPGQGKGRKFSPSVKLKISVSNVYKNIRPSSPEEKRVEHALNQLGYMFKREVPIAFFDKAERFVAAYRTDFFFPQGVLNKEHPIILAVDGVYYHRQPKNMRRDQQFNVFSTRSGAIVIRMWGSEIPKDISEIAVKLKQIFAKSRVVKPGTLRFKTLELTERTAKTHPESIEWKYTGSSKEFTWEEIDASLLKSIIDLIDHGDFIDPDTALS